MCGRSYTTNRAEATKTNSVRFYKYLTFAVATAFPYDSAVDICLMHLLQQEGEYTLEQEVHMPRSECNRWPIKFHWTITILLLCHKHLYAQRMVKPHKGLYTTVANFCVYVSKFIRWINLPHPPVATAHRQLDPVSLWSLCSQLMSCHQVQTVDRVQTLWCLPAAGDTKIPLNNGMYV